MENADQKVAALVDLSAPEKGDVVWTAKQVKVPQDKPPTGHHEVNWSFGPVKIVGYIDTAKLGTGLTVSILGISLGPIHGDLREGLVVKFELFQAKGNVKLYLKNGHELRAHLDVAVMFDGQFSGDYKVTSF